MVHMNTEININDLIQNITLIVDKESRELKTKERDDTLDLELYMAKLIEYVNSEINISGSKNKMSGDTITTNIISIINDIKKTSNPAEKFRNEIDKLKEQYGRAKPRIYEIIFPLNLPFDREDIPPSFNIFKKSINYIDPRDYTYKYLNHMKQSDYLNDLRYYSQNSILLEEDILHFDESELKKYFKNEFSLEDLKETLSKHDLKLQSDSKVTRETKDSLFIESGNDKFRLEQVEGKIQVYSVNDFFSYWRYSCSACDVHSVINELEKILETLLGQITYYFYGNKLTELQYTTTKWKIDLTPVEESISEIKMPFLYMIFEDSKFKDIKWNKSDSSRRTRVQPHNNFDAMEFQNFFPENFQDVCLLNNRLEKKLMSAFRLYLAGMTESKNEEAFLFFWRGFEVLTLAQKDTSTDKICDRIRSMVMARDKNNFKSSIEILAKKRNKIVHEGYECEIHIIDLQFSKLVLEMMIFFYINHVADYDSDEFEYIFNNGYKNKDTLKRNKRLLEDILNWNIEK